jgi:hypothetical protein
MTQKPEVVPRWSARVMFEDVVPLLRVAGCRAPNLGSTVHHVLVPGSVADTHNSNKIDIKNYTFIANRELYYMIRVA